MARRRMFDLDVISSNKFIMLHKSAQCLYYTLGMNTDDEGFVANPLLLIRGYGFEQKDLQELIDNEFIILFDTGTIYVSHHEINNSIRRDRLIPTKCQYEKSLIGKENNYVKKRAKCDIYREKIYKESELPYSFNKKITLAFNNEICPICGTRMITTNTKTAPSVQHNTPISKGGKHEISNISIICRTCNAIIQNKPTGKLNNDVVIEKWNEMKGINLSLVENF